MPVRDRETWTEVCRGRYGNPWVDCSPFREIGLISHPFIPGMQVKRLKRRAQHASAAWFMGDIPLPAFEHVIKVERRQGALLHLPIKCGLIERAQRQCGRYLAAIHELREHPVSYTHLRAHE